MTIVQDDECDGQPRIDGTAVTVIDIYHSAVRQGRDPAEVAHKYDVDLARVHEAIAYYYDHATAMRGLEDWDEIVPATSGRDD